ncbi:MAG TPA: fumarylacetoacetate hydrolase family protein [Baekduia sp.]|uniref:fumarylacetoacetate hydrolase family protein n=1 Tax=Baekduia sp. TaxID=2600305 RepID=UPI002D787014|nr:fumarylacetoacetate hydrolase family protein [Baekduia sp.]HET6506102.1 fumarylacetoacetate hydrolase family protein [Baekduia sp.]
MPRFASLLIDGRPVAARIEEDNSTGKAATTAAAATTTTAATTATATTAATTTTATTATAVPLRGIAELGRDTPSDVLADDSLLDRDAAVALDDPSVTIRPVVPRPDKVICVGLNYREHVAESLRDEPEYPVLFTKWASTLTGPTDPIALPAESTKIDYEGELVVVIGRRARRVAKADALSVVAGYAVANDLSMRDFQHKSHQWLQGKAWDASTPVGPFLVTPDEVPDPQALRLRTIVNGRTVQDATTDLMIFDVATLVAAVSEFATLQPGDLILTGTPGGVGVRRDPPLLLGPGDVVAVEVDGVGRIENTMKEEDRR